MHHLETAKIFSVCGKHKTNLGRIWYWKSLHWTYFDTNWKIFWCHLTISNYYKCETLFRLPSNLFAGQQRRIENKGWKRNWIEIQVLTKVKCRTLIIDHIHLFNSCTEIQKKRRTKRENSPFFMSNIVLIGTCM